MFNEMMRQISETLKDITEIVNDDMLYEGCGEYRTPETLLRKAHSFLTEYLGDLVYQNAVKESKGYDPNKPLTKEELINYVDKPLWVISDNYLDSMRWRVLEKIHVYKNARFILNFTDTTGGIDYDDLKLYRVETNDKVSCKKDNDR